MDELVKDLIMNGYDVHFNTLRTASGLFHPQAQDKCEVIVSKRLPGLQRKGGNAFAKGYITYTILPSKKDLEKVFKNLVKKVDKINTVEKGRRA